MAHRAENICHLSPYIRVLLFTSGINDPVIEDFGDSTREDCALLVPLGVYYAVNETGTTQGGEC